MPAAWEQPCPVDPAVWPCPWHQQLHPGRLCSVFAFHLGRKPLRALKGREGEEWAEGPLKELLGGC